MIILTWRGKILHGAPDQHLVDILSLLFPPVNHKELEANKMLLSSRSKEPYLTSFFLVPPYQVKELEMCYFTFIIRVHLIKLTHNI